MEPDYSTDLQTEILRLATALGFDLSDVRAATLAREASLHRMRSRASEVIRNGGVVWKDDQALSARRKLRRAALPHVRPVRRILVTC